MAVKHIPGMSVKLGALLDQLQHKRLKVGWLESDKYDDGTPVAYVAAIQEFGSAPQGIPPRPFMRPTIAEKEVEWGKIAAGYAKMMLNGKIDGATALDSLGGSAAGDIAKTISKIQTPKLKDSTIKARLRKMADGKTIGNLTKPLVESGLMFDTLNHIVEDK